MDPADKSSIEEKVAETLGWLDANQTAEVEEYEEKHKELEAVCTPIIQKMAAAAGGGGMPGGDMPGGGMPGGMPGGGMSSDMPDMDDCGGFSASNTETDSGPKIEEID